MIRSKRTVPTKGMIISFRTAGGGETEAGVVVIPPMWDPNTNGDWVAARRATSGPGARAEWVAVADVVDVVPSPA